MYRANVLYPAEMTMDDNSSMAKEMSSMFKSRNY